MPAHPFCTALFQLHVNRREVGGDRVAGEYSISQLPAGTYQLTVQALANSFRAFENYRTPKASRTNPSYSSLREIIGEVSSEASDLRPGPPDLSSRTRKPAGLRSPMSESAASRSITRQRSTVSDKGRVISWNMGTGSA